MTAKLDASAIIYPCAERSRSVVKANVLPLVARVCGELVITAGVYEEVVSRGKSAGHRDAETIEKVVQDRLIRVVSLEEAGRQRLEQAGFPSSLGKGEQETIVEALEQECLAVLDDARARASAAILGATLCRTETLLVEALARRMTKVTSVMGLAEFEATLLRLAQIRGMRADDLAELLRLGRLIAEVLTDERTSH